MIELGSRPALTALVGALLDAWPEHRRYVERSFESRPADTLDVSEDVSGSILALQRLSGGLTSLCADYRYSCDAIVMPEEIIFGAMAGIGCRRSPTPIANATRIRR